MAQSFDQRVKENSPKELNLPNLRPGQALRSLMQRDHSFNTQRLLRKEGYLNIRNSQAAKDLNWNASQNVQDSDTRSLCNGLESNAQGLQGCENLNVSRFTTGRRFEWPRLMHQ